MNSVAYYEVANFLIMTATTLEYRRRKAEFDQRMSELGEGEVLVAYCERFGIAALTLEVKDFFEYNNALDLLENPWSAVSTIEWFNRAKSA